MELRVPKNSGCHCTPIVKGLVGVFDGFDQPLIVIRCCTQFGCEFEYPLMMHGIHLGRMRLQDARQASARLERYMVRGSEKGSVWKWFAKCVCCFVCVARSRCKLPP